MNTKIAGDSRTGFPPQLLHLHLSCNRFCDTESSLCLRKTDLFVRGVLQAYCRAGSYTGLEYKATD